MPEQTSRPVTLVHSHEIMKLRVFTDLNKREEGALPKQMTITTSTTAKLKWHGLLPSQKETIPNTTNQHTPQQCLISLPNMARVKDLQRTRHVKKCPARNPLPAHRSAATVPCQALKTALNRTSKIAQGKQPRVSPANHRRVPPKANRQANE